MGLLVSGQFESWRRPRLRGGDLEFTGNGAARSRTRGFRDQREADRGQCGSGRSMPAQRQRSRPRWDDRVRLDQFRDCAIRSEEHTSELQSLRHLVCRLLLEKKKINEYIRLK